MNSALIPAIVVGGALLNGMVVLFAWWRLTRRLRRIEALQVKAASTDTPTSMLVTAVAQVDARLRSIEHAPAAPIAPPAPVAAPDDRAYQLARRMANNGADAHRIAESCDIGLDEAELLTRLRTGIDQAA